MEVVEKTQLRNLFTGIPVKYCYHIISTQGLKASYCIVYQIYVYIFIYDTVHIGWDFNIVLSETARVLSDWVGVYRKRIHIIT